MSKRFTPVKAMKAIEGPNDIVAEFRRMEIESIPSPPLFLRTPSEDELAAHQDLVEWDGSSEDPYYNSPKYDLISFIII